MMMLWDTYTSCKKKKKKKQTYIQFQSVAALVSEVIKNTLKEWYDLCETSSVVSKKKNMSSMHDLSTTQAYMLALSKPISPVISA